MKCTWSIKSKKRYKMKSVEEKTLFKKEFD